MSSYRTPATPPLASSSPGTPAAIRAAIRAAGISLFAAMGVAGCGNSKAPARAPVVAPPFPASLARPRAAQHLAGGLPRDDLGRRVGLQHPAQRIICLGPGATEAVCALGLGSRLVGRDSASDYPQAARKVAVAGDYRGPFFETALALRPDLIVVQGETYDATRADLWSHKCKAPVAVIGSHSVRGVAADIRKLGAWLGAGARAEALVRPLPAPPARRVRAFFAVDSSLWTAGRDTLVGDVMQHAGLVNVADAVPSYKQYSIESLLAANPEVYIGLGKANERTAIVARLKATPGLRDLACIKNGAIVIADGDMLVRPGPRLWQGIPALAAATHRFVKR